MGQKREKAVIFVVGHFVPSSYFSRTPYFSVSYLSSGGRIHSPYLTLGLFYYGL